MAYCSLLLVSSAICTTACPAPYRYCPDNLLQKHYVGVTCWKTRFQNGMLVTTRFVSRPTFHLIYPNAPLFTCDRMCSILWPYGEVLSVIFCSVFASR